jgi:hypothetical protein
MPNEGLVLTEIFRYAACPQPAIVDRAGNFYPAAELPRQHPSLKLSRVLFASTAPRALSCLAGVHAAAVRHLLHVGTRYCCSKVVISIRSHYPECQTLLGFPPLFLTIQEYNPLLSITYHILVTTPLGPVT